MNKLSPRQVQIHALLKQGHKPHRIAQMLGMTRKTVRYHLKEIKRKLGEQSA